MTVDERGRTDGHPTPDELTGFHDGELDTPDRARISSHLETCADCAARLSAFSDLDDIGRTLNEDLPGPEFWPGLEARILKRVAREGGAPEGANPEPVRDVTELAPAGPAWIERAFGWKRLAWTMATAAALGFVILSTEKLFHKSILEPEVAFRSRVAEPAMPGTDGGPSISLETERSDMSTTADAVPPASPLVTKSASPPAAPEASPPAPEMTLRNAGDRAASAADQAEPAGERAASAADQAEPAGEWAAPAADQAEPAAEITAVAAKPVPRAKKESLKDGEADGAALELADEDPDRYPAEVDERLGRKNDETARQRVAPPEEDLKSGLAGPAAKFAREKSSFRDFQIVYAAAFRALEAGEFDLAARGFEMVARHVPGSDLARDADYQGRLARFRGRINGGADSIEILREASNRADVSWQEAEGNPGHEVCRRALADERVRITLLEEFNPNVDRGRFEERVRTLSRCA